MDRGSAALKAQPRPLDLNGTTHIPNVSAHRPPAARNGKLISVWVALDSSCLAFSADSLSALQRDLVATKIHSTIGLAKLVEQGAQRSRYQNPHRSRKVSPLVARTRKIPPDSSRIETSKVPPPQIVNDDPLRGASAAFPIRKRCSSRLIDNAQNLQAGNSPRITGSPAVEHRQNRAGTVITASETGSPR